MTLEAQLKYIETHYPEAWAYLTDNNPELPKFDDNDDIVSEKEEKQNASIS